MTRRGRGQGRGGGGRGDGESSNRFGEGGGSSVASSQQSMAGSSTSSSNSTSSTSRPPPPPPPHPPYQPASSRPSGKTSKNGSKGIRDTHGPSAISEAMRISFSTQLNQLREDPSKEELSFPPTLDNIHRKFLHALAGQLGLVSKSSGKGDGKRFITVKKKKKGRNCGEEDGEEEDITRHPPFQPGRESLELLRGHVTKHPLSKREYESLLKLCVSRSVTLAAAAAAAAAAEEGGKNGGGGHRAAVRAAEKQQGPRTTSSSLTATAAIASNSKNTARNQGKKQQGYYDPAAQEQLLIKRKEGHAAAQAKKEANRKYQAMLTARKALPAWQHSSLVVDLIKTHQVVIVSGETGCGKSTQVPQFLLDDEAIGPTLKMAVTQPRRISAISVAERVASERMEEVGKTVGYHIRQESEFSEGSQVVFMTPGVLLRMLMGDPELREFNVVMIDEVHERDKNTDFLLIILRDLLLRHRSSDLRLILMSATLQTGKLSAYFGGCPVATIGSTCYPVQEFYLEDVLLQTRYLQKLGLVKDGSSGSSNSKSGSSKKAFGTAGKGGGQGDNALLRALCQATPVYACEMCGQKGFRSPEEYGTHIVLCDGVVIEVEDEGEDEGMREGGFQALEEQLLRDLEGQGKEGYVPEYEDWGETPARINSSGPLAALARGEEGGFISTVEDVGEGEEVMREPHRHSALECPIPAATEVQGQEALRAYQYAFDDELVDYDLIQSLLVYIVESGYRPGAILVFLPGWDDISRLRDALRRDPVLGRADKFLLLPLHSGIPSQQQREVFKSPPAGVRKIVLATNIAETSVTIDDIVFVVDSCRVKEKNYDPFLKLCTLQPTWISKASARQRRGRAGRTMAGVCFHLCSRRRYESLKEFKESELLTTPLEELCLQAKLLGLAPGYDPFERHVVSGIGGGKKKKKKKKTAAAHVLLASLALDVEEEEGEEEEEKEDREISRLKASRLEGDSIMSFLGKALDAPHDLSVKNAIDLLVQIGALTAREQLTDLGHKLARLPLDPRIGKMVLWGQLLGCGRTALKVGCALAYRDPFVLPLTADGKAKAATAKMDLAGGTMSDHLALLGALSGFESAAERGGAQASSGYCDRYFLSKSTLTTVVDVVKQVGNELAGMGFENPLFWSSNSSESKISPVVEHDRNLALLTAVVCAGLYPSVASRTVGDVNFTTTCQKKAKLHQSSVNYHPGSRFTRASTAEAHRAMGGGPEFLVFSEVVRTPSIFVISNTTPVPVVSLFLMCGDLKVRGMKGLLSGEKGRQEVGGEEAEGEEAEGEEEGEEEVEEEDDDGEGNLGEQALLLLDDWITFRCPKEVALQLLALRLRLQDAFLVFVKHPQARLSETCQDALRSAVRLLTLENHYMPAGKAAAAVFGGGGRNGLQQLHLGGRGRGRSRGSGCDSAYGGMGRRGGGGRPVGGRIGGGSGGRGGRVDNRPILVSPLAAAAARAGGLQQQQLSPSANPNHGGYRAPQPPRK